MPIIRKILILLALLGAHSAFALNYETRPAALTPEDRQEIRRIEHYLSDIHSLSARFIQSAPDGGVTTGKFLLLRPGRFRMEYEGSAPVLMIGRKDDIVYYDAQLDQVSHVGMEATMIGFLTLDQVRFDDSVILTGLARKAGVIRLSLVDCKRPKDGSLTLEFSDAPLSLRNMIVTDRQGEVTSLALSDARFNLPLKDEQFIFHDPHPNRRNVVK
jgi:outer membrane lipoprotein-sorting protein